MVIHVPDLTHPTKCWKASPALVRCTLPKGHAGPHSWARGAAPRYSPINPVIWKTLNDVLLWPQPTQIRL